MADIFHTVSMVSLSGLLAVGCSLSTFERQSCSGDQACRDVFGANAVCGSAGFCDVLPVSPRCDRTYPEDLLQRPERYPNAIVFGSLMDVSEVRKEARENAARLAFMGVQDQGGLDGRQLALVFCNIEENNDFDALTSQEAAISSARHLVDTYGVPAIIGPSGSDATLAVFDAVRESGTLVISPSATSPTLTAAEFTEDEMPSDETPGLLWRTAPPDTVQADVIARDMSARQVSSLAIIYREGAYGTGLKDAFIDANNTVANKVATVIKEPFNTQSQRGEAITNIGALMPAVEEVLFISGDRDDVVAFYAAVQASNNYDSKNLFLTDTAATADLLDDSLTSIYPRIRGTRPQPGDPSSNVVLADFINGYTPSFGQNPLNFSFTAHNFDAAWLVLYGTARSVQVEGEASGLGIARGLRRISQGSAVAIRASSWDTVKETLADPMGQLNLTGASGELDYDPTTEETDAAVEVWEINDDEVMGEFAIKPSADQPQ